MRAVRKTFRNFKKKITRRKKYKTRTPSNTKKSLTMRARRIRQRTKTPMIKRTTASQRKTIRKQVKTKCLKSICNLKFDLENRKGKTKLKAFFTNSNGRDCILGSDINLRLCGLGDEVEVKQTFLGEGGFSRVFPIQGNDKKIVRVTRGFESQRENGYILEKQSFKLIEKLNNADVYNSKHIVRIDKYGIYKTLFYGSYYYGLYSLQDKYLGGDLFDVQKEYKKQIREYPKFMYKIMMDLAEATAFIHKHNICNRDMKAENVMLERKINSLNDVPQIKIIDFGLATTIEKNGLVSLENTLRVGTTNFKSPEMIKGERYGALTDVWSLAVIYYDLYRFNTPFANGFERDSQIPEISYGTMEDNDFELYELLRDKMLVLKETRISSQEVFSLMKDIYRKKSIQKFITGNSNNSRV